MGESAGSWSVFYQLLNPTSSGLFTAAIGQSGAATGGIGWGQSYLSPVNILKLLQVGPILHKGGGSEQWEEPGCGLQLHQI